MPLPKLILIYKKMEGIISVMILLIYNCYFIWILQFIGFLSEHGLDATEFINTLHTLIGLEPYTGGQKSTRRGVGINGLIDDIIAILPIDDLKALFDEKLTTSTDFKDLYDAIRGAEFQVTIIPGIFNILHY